MLKKLFLGTSLILVTLTVLYVLLPTILVLIKYGPEHAITQLGCTLRNKPSPIVYIYPAHGARDVPLDSIVFAKYAHPIPSGPHEGPIIIQYADGTIPKPNIFSGFTAEYFYAGPLFDDTSPPTDVEYDIVHKKLEDINQNPQLASSFRGESMWEPNQHILVKFYRFCYNPLKLEFYTASK